MATDSGQQTEDQIKAENERLTRALDIAKSEARESRKQKEALEAEKAEKDTAALSETEKSEARFAAVEAKLEASETREKEQRIRIAIITEATALGFANPEHAFILIDKAEVEVTSDGSVTGFEKSLKALAESGSLAMADDKRSDGLGTPQGKGKPASGKSEQEAPKIRI
ncbi:MAG: hypothetical protein KAJ73_01025 [Zetaproteobacteria bacterium]|nr:hypothetical protein [Zetaproteobacteria bacterium]